MHLDKVEFDALLEAAIVKARIEQREIEQRYHEELPAPAGV
jgi:hypothetical protein